MLMNKRKFDIRAFAMLTSINGNLKGFAYDEFYLRTSSSLYDTDNFDDKTVHLTNDSI